MNIKRITSALVASAAASAVLIGSAGTPAQALRIDCVTIFVDWDTDETRTICTISW